VCWAKINFGPTATFWAITVILSLMKYLSANFGPTTTDWTVTTYSYNGFVSNGTFVCLKAIVLITDGIVLVPLAML
jgi:hypothetical protein